MATTNIITGNFLEAMDEIKADVVVSFMTERGILWGFSKLLAAEYVEVSDMLKVNHCLNPLSTGKSVQTRVIHPKEHKALS